MVDSAFQKVYQLTQKIPLGMVTTYGEMARILRLNPRTVGWALHANKSRLVPCHRVVNIEGRVAPNFGFGGGREQRRRLEEEGVKFKDEIHVDLTKCLWKYFETN